MTEARLHGARVLVLEDDYYQATDLQAALEGAGATVIGPFGNEADATVAAAGERLDCAFIDVNLGAGPSFAVPLALAARSVPFAFVTGYDPDTIPQPLARAPRFEKPIEPRAVVAIAAQLVKRD